jgi:FKBP-type peptidyl-prolyl cis-trans isomerase 2
MKRHVAVLVTAMLIVASCSGGGSSSGDLVAQEGDIVEVHYVLTLDDGVVLESSRDRGDTLTFTVGGGKMIAGFDEAVRGALVGEVIDATIQPADGYGESDPALILELPIAEGQEDVAVGDSVYLSNGQPAVVLEIVDGMATVDANHRLAGKVLHFEIEVISITRG